MNVQKLSANYIRCIIVSIVLSAFSMFLLSYLWHGILLTDFLKISYPLHIFILFMLSLYIILALISTILFYFVISKKNFTSSLFLGAVLGMLVFLISFVIGFGYTSYSQLKFVFIDLI